MVVEKELAKKSGNGAGVYTVIVDDCDAGLLDRKWHIKVDKENRYMHGGSRGAFVSLHQLVMESVLGHAVPRGLVIDHINGNGLDNRRENLRVVTKLQNSANKRKASKSKSGFRGAYYHERLGKYEARITISLGYFDTAEEAHEAHKKAHIERHGKFSPYYEEEPDNAQS